MVIQKHSRFAASSPPSSPSPSSSPLPPRHRGVDARSFVLPRHARDSIIATELSQNTHRSVSMHSEFAHHGQIHFEYLCFGVDIQECPFDC